MSTLAKVFGAPTRDVARLLELYLPLWATSFALAVIGGLLLLDARVVEPVSRIWLASAALQFSLYAVHRLSGHLAVALASTFGVLSVAVFAAWPWLLALCYVTAAAGLAFAVLDVRQTHCNWLAVGMATAACVLAVLGTWFYYRFDAYWQVESGRVASDTLFHTSVAAMLKSYGVASTGLNGLVQLPYHVGSHALFAATSTLSGVPVLSTYAIGGMVLFPPLLVLSVANAVSDQPGTPSPTMAWTLSALALLGLPYLLSDWAMWGRYFFSESYAVALIFFVSALPLAVRPHLNAGGLGVLVLLVVLTTYAKSSVGLILVGLLFARLLFLAPVQSRPPEALACLAAAALFLFVMSFAFVDGGGVIRFDPLHFVSKYGQVGASLDQLQRNGGAASAIAHLVDQLRVAGSLLLFVIMHFLPTWILLIWRVSVVGFWVLFRDGWALFSLAALAVGLVATLALDILDNANSYFSNVAMFVSLPPLLAMVQTRWLDDETRWWRVVPPILVAMAVMAWPEIRGKSALKSPPAAAIRPSALVEALRCAQTSAAYRSILRLREQSPLAAANPVRDCRVKPFLFPALSERAWIGALDVTGACAYKHFGYESYRVPDASAPPFSRQVLPPHLVAQDWPADGVCSPAR